MLRWYVKELIEARGMSMGKLSRKANLSYETVMKICRDPFHHGKVTTQDKLARALNVDLSEVLKPVPTDDTHPREGDSQGERKK
jgi:transcriptional regulator with XRE-family HTH domain